MSTTLPRLRRGVAAALLALVTLLIKISLEWRYADQIAASRRH